MSSLFGLNKPNTNLRKNVFDLSEKTLFSLSAGMLLPCFVRELNPGEKVQLHVSALTRTQPLNTAAFVRTRQYYHWFFVPFKQLWTYWDNFYNGVDYRQSALMRSSGKKSLVVPSVGMFHSFGALAGAGIWKKYADSDTTVSDAVKAKTKDEFGYPLYRGASRLFDMLGYGMRITHDRVDDTVFTPGALRPNVESELRPNYSHGGRSAGSRSSAGSSSSGAQVPPPDPHLSGSDYSSVHQKRVDVLKNFNSISEFFDSFGDKKPDEAYNNILKLIHNGSYRNTDVSINLFRLLAYQKIYHDFYRREDYESSDPSVFNLDDFAGDLDTVTLTPDRLNGITRLRYRWKPKDLFTGVVPSELFGSDNIFTKTGFESLGELSVSNASGINPDSIKIGSANVTTRTVRAAFAIEKMMRLTRRAGGYDYISQTLAHFGFEVPKGRGDKVDFLGGTTSTINISEVITSADSSTSVVGQTFGKGVGTVGDGDGWIDFTAREHGLVMCITSVVPEEEYSAEGLNAFNVKLKRGDYFHPELQDLGLQPLHAYEFQNKMNFLSGKVGSVNRSTVLGFVPRYAEYKTAFDTLHGEFRSGRSMSAWASRSTLAVVDSGVAINTLKIDPKCLDSVFAVNYDGKEKNDQFMVSAQFLCKIIRPMSVTGQNL